MRSIGPGRLAAGIRLVAAAVALLVFPPVVNAQTNSPVPPDRDLPVPYRVEIVASRLQAPWSVVFAPDGRMFFSERPGRVGVMENGKLLLKCPIKDFTK